MLVYTNKIIRRIKRVFATKQYQTTITIDTIDKPL